MLNYCEEYKMLDTGLRANEDRVLNARATWEQLFRK
jgi:hypothetical protein